MFLGIDIGSSSSKVVILSPQREIVTAQVVNLGTGTRGAGQVVARGYFHLGGNLYLAPPLFVQCERFLGNGVRAHGRHLSINL